MLQEEARLEALRLALAFVEPDITADELVAIAGTFYKFLTQPVDF